MKVPISLRGMNYILISKNIIQNTSTHYNYLSRLTTRLREEGIIPMDCFVDGGRYITDIDDEYETIDQFIERGINHVKYANNDYRIPRWLNQPHYVEVWVEKDAMRGILNSIINTTGKREVRIVPTGGQESVTYAWNNARRLKQKQREGKQVHIRYFGDLDPAGEAIEKNIWEKLTLSPYNLNNIDFKRVGVTNEQRIEFKLIANTDANTMKKLKQTPTRFEFMKKYGLESEDELFQIEVDALQAIAPERFKTMLLKCVDEFFSEDIYQENKDDNEITPTEFQICQKGLFQVRDLHASIENRLDELNND